MQTHTDNRIKYTCTVCEKSFPVKTSLSRHLQIHNKEDIVKCHKCNGNYKKGYLRNHLKNAHGERQSKTCPQCDGTFLDQACLTLHIKRVHKTSRVPCPVCAKEYKGKRNLSEHLKIHTKRKKDFSCNFCKKSFFNKKSLKIHQHIHLGTNKKECLVCEGKFSNVNDHMKNVHKTQTKPKETKGDFSCKVCKKSFFKRRLLEKHVAIHLGKNKKICPICNGMSSRIKDHMKIHKIKNESMNMIKPQP